MKKEGPAKIAEGVQTAEVEWIAEAARIAETEDLTLVELDIVVVVRVGRRRCRQRTRSPVVVRIDALEGATVEVRSTRPGNHPVLAEEFGLLGVLTLLALYMFVIGRGLFIAVQAHDTYSRLLAGSISLTFMVYVFVNTAMVTGLVPVVGVPLPLVSFGGTSMVTLMAGFGILMSIHSHRKLLPH